MTHKRISPQIWPDDVLAKHLLLFGNKAKICMYCIHLSIHDDINLCTINNLCLEDDLIKKSVCSSFINIYEETPSYGI